MRRVEILVSGDEPRAAALVFRTLRVGFPTAPVRVTFNTRNIAVEEAVMEAVAGSAEGAIEFVGNEFVGKGAPIEFAAPLVHGDWVRRRLYAGSSPVVFVDTDMIFTAAVEDWAFDTGLAGRLIPAFKCPFTKCLTQPRLHMSLLFVDPVRLWAEIGATAHQTRLSPLVDLWCAAVVPPGRFYDTAAFAYALVGGTPFTPAQLDSYDHLNAGTWVDELAPAIADGDLKAFHELAYTNPAAIRGCWRAQDDWYSRQGH